MYDILNIQLLLCDDICKYLLLVHAFTGCDSTCTIFSIGKPKAFDTLMKVKYMCSNFCQHSDIKAAERKAMLLLCGCKTLESTNSLPHRNVGGKGRYLLLNQNLCYLPNRCIHKVTQISNILSNINLEVYKKEGLLQKSGGVGMQRMIPITLQLATNNQLQTIYSI